MDKLASHDHERHKTRRGNKENRKHGRRRTPKVTFVSKKNVLSDPLCPMKQYPF